MHSCRASICHMKQHRARLVLPLWKKRDRWRYVYILHLHIISCRPQWSSGKAVYLTTLNSRQGSVPAIDEKSKNITSYYCWWKEVVEAGEFIYNLSTLLHVHHDGRVVKPPNSHTATMVRYPLPPKKKAKILRHTIARRTALCLYITFTHYLMSTTMAEWWSRQSHTHTRPGSIPSMFNKIKKIKKNK